MNQPVQPTRGPRAVGVTTAEPVAGRPAPVRRILFLYVGPLSSFIRQDLELLQAHHQVRPLRVGSGGTSPLAAAAAVRASDVVVCWFGSLWFLPALLAARALRRPVLLVAGGYDVADMREIGYGNMRSGPARALGRAVFRTAGLVACLSASAAAETERNAGVSPRRIRVVHCAFPAERMGADPPGAKEPLVLTVGGGDSTALRRKGLLTVARTSRLMPDTTFIIAGRHDPGSRELLARAGGPNLELPGFVSDAELMRLYARAKVYFQPSLHEGFGCSVAEAMLHGCVPVVTRRFALPEVVGPCGYYVEPEDPEGSVAVIRTALAGPAPAPPRARIMEQFPLARREAQLLEMMEELARRRRPA